jgi:AcrR family transcriptional regulator
MPRQPTARQKVIDASRRIVMERGAGSLTYDEIAQVSGVTRGGITYHFPTKQRLLQALVEQDIAQWQELEETNTPCDCPSGAAELIAFLRAHTSEEPDRRRFVTGMLSAATLDPPVLDPAREYSRERIDAMEPDDGNVRREILRLAAIGLFWSDLFGCPEYPDALRTRIADVLEQLALEWSNDTNQQQAQEA